MEEKFTLIQKYVWLVTTIQRAGRISFAELNRQWRESPLSGGESLPKRTFHKWKDAVQSLFDLIIDNEKSGDFCYYIANPKTGARNDLAQWMLGTLSVSNMLLRYKRLASRIVLEDIPAGRDYLPLILDAMNSGHRLRLTYRTFRADATRAYHVEPYCLKLFRQRWYLLGKVPYRKQPTIYALDRFEALSPLPDERFTMPKNFSADDFFYGCVGVIPEDGVPPEEILLRVTGGQANYLRTRPIHSSQREVERTDDASVFSLHVRPTLDFFQEVLIYTPHIEILKPRWVRDEMAKRIQAMNIIYDIPR